MDYELGLDSGRLSNLFNSLHEQQKAYVDTIHTERLILRKEPTPDFVSTVYAILLKESQEKIGEVTLIYDGEIWYKINQPFRRKGYATEAVSKLIEISKQSYFYLSIDFMNKASKKVAKKLGFIYKKRNRKSLVFEKTKSNM